jgi:hypothetical protein
MPSEIRDALIARIIQAFSDVEYPGNDKLTDSTYGDEPAALVQEFSAKTDWRQLDAKFLDQAPKGWGSALSFFSGTALRFYLPAYLIADVRGELKSVDPAFRLCSSLVPPGEKKKIAKIWGGGTMGERVKADFARYDQHQMSVIVAYLRWKLESDDGANLMIEQALNHYWLKRDAE